MSSLGKSIYHFAPSEVTALFKHAHRVYRYPAFDALCTIRKCTYGRLLVVISKKIANAAKRNKIRRQIKSIFYESNLFECNYDFMIILKKEGLTLSFLKLKEYLLTTPEKTDRYFSRQAEKKYSTPAA